MSTPAGLAIVVLLIVALAGAALLAGCASDPRSERAQPMRKSVCYVKPLGSTEDGYTVLFEACQSTEAFAASQK